MAAPMKFACVRCGKFIRFPQNYLSRVRSKSTTSAEIKNQFVKWESVIGLEIHAQISSHSKLFSGSATTFSAPINTQVSLFDAAMPGTLPVLNRRCVEAGVMTALALKSEINPISKFDRKHYFYADLPTGYQITQQREPIALGGEVEFLVFDSSVSKHPVTKTARLVQIQLEQDSGKSLHDEEENKSLIDLNRAGMALMEIVTRPDFSTAEEAAGFVKELRRILQVIGTCDGKMSEGSLRVDANISVNKVGESYGERTEVKNLNSIRNMVKAIEYEIKRQIKELEAGNKITPETRNYNIELGTTIPMRDKEKVLDYRFMPEPNLPPLHIHRQQSLPASLPAERVVLFDHLLDNLNELPCQKRQRIQEKYQLPLVTVATLVNEEGLLEFFEDVIEVGHMDIKMVTKLLVNDYLGYLNKHDMTVAESPVSVENIRELHDILKTGVISLQTASKVLEKLILLQGSRVKDIIQQENWYQITDQETVVKLCKLIIEKNPKLVRGIKRGKESALLSLCSRVQKESQGLTKYDMVKDTIQTLLERD